MSVKLSKKELNETGIAQDAFYLGGNVYNYENAIFYLGIGDLENLEKSVKSTFSFVKSSMNLSLF